MNKFINILFSLSFLLFILFFGIFYLKLLQGNYPINTTEISTSKSNKYGDIGNSDKYYTCYGNITNLYKQNGFHKSNRIASIESKETICREYSREENSNYSIK